MSNEPAPLTALSDVRPPEKPKRAPRRRKDDDALEQEQLTDEEINAAGRKWYFVHTYSGHENKVRSAIRATVEQMDAKDKVYHVVVPTEDEIEIRDGQRRTVKRKLYPGYVLVQTIELKRLAIPTRAEGHTILWCPWIDAIDILKIVFREVATDTAWDRARIDISAGIVKRVVSQSTIQ